MIGVIAKPGQRAALEEFFELFKTPWEFFQPDRTYDVVLATADDLLGVRARVLLIYGADTRSSDSARGLLPR